MSRNSIELEIVRSVKTAAEGAYMTVTASLGIALARFALIDFGRSDFPNALLETAGTIFGVSLAIIAGTEAVKNITSSLHTKTNSPTE
jgi:hypothetical protein